MALRAFSEYYFEQRVNNALEKVKTILENTRNPQYAADVQHEYEDKYLLAEFLGNASVASHSCVLDYIGVTAKPLEQLKEWAQKQSVTLRLNVEEGCKFLRKAVREVESDTKHVTKAGILGKFESFTLTKVHEFFWEYKVKWELIAFAGVDTAKSIVLQSRTGIIEIKTSTETPSPKPETVVRNPIDVNITWLLQHMDNNRTPTFSIDRTAKKCRTPRRNPEVDRALEFFQSYHNWAKQVCSTFTGSIFPSQTSQATANQPSLDVSAINDNTVFVPVLPLFESSPSSTSKIPPAFMNSFLAEQNRSLEEKRANLAKVFPSNEKLITIIEANLIVALQHANHVSEAFSEGVDYIESMLYKQFVAAIGKEVTPVDFANYLTFHNRKIFAEQYRPQPFSYAVRRPEHSPEGTLSISAKLDDGKVSSPISTIVSHNIATRPMFFSINEATRVGFLGDRFLHGYVSHQFSGYSGISLFLEARSRQFSSFILMVGRIVSASEFDPKYAILIQNKDELKIPLMLETIPTPKEFKDAISSLSPEQQRFCKAFRSMQLESTLFGVAVIQIKPQLELVLKLPDDSLTKEIQLTQDLLTLFIKYQIPTDLVSYDGPEYDSVEGKVARVKEYVARMNAMLDNAKKEELQEAQQEQQMRAAQQYLPQPDGLILQSLSLMSDDMVSRSRSYGGKEKMKDKNSSVQRHGAISDASGGAGGGGGARLALGSARNSAIKPAPQSVAREVSREPAVVARSESPRRDAHVPKDEPKAVKEPQKQEFASGKDLAESGNKDSELVDYTQIPVVMEQAFEEFDENNALRPTIINPSDLWKFSFQKTLLSEPEEKVIAVSDQEKERNKAFDLLDALTKSGVLPVRHAALHVVIASTHCFDKSIIDTVVKDNINPIEKVENSALIVASTIHQTEPINLIAKEHVARVSMTSPRLMAGPDQGNLIAM